MSVGIKGNEDGSGAIQVNGSDAITISTGLNTTFVGTASVATGALYPIVPSTAKAYNWNGATTNTFLEFTALPSWVKRITLMFSGLSTNGTSDIIVQLGTGATPTYTTTGYLGTCITGTASLTNYTTGLLLSNVVTATDIGHGNMYITNVTGNTWTETHCYGASDSTLIRHGAGAIPLAAALTAIRITTAGGVNVFDAGTVNIFYE
jgi:hypothetical protein